MSNLKQWIQRERALLDAATPGPWEAYFVFGSSDLPCSIVKETGRTKVVEGTDVEVDDNDYICDVNSEAKNPTPDFRFIANVRTSHEQAIAALEIAVEAIDKLALPNDVSLPSRIDLDQRISYAMGVKIAIEALLGKKESGE